MTHARGHAGCGVLPSGRVAVVGGGGSDYQPRRDGEVFDPETQTVATLGNLPNDGEAWAGSVLLPSGRILGIPYRANAVLEIDPETRTVTTWGDLSPYRDRNGTFEYWDDACASNSGWRAGAYVPATGLVYAYPQIRQDMLRNMELCLYLNCF